jgi:hypothetical protein
VPVCHKALQPIDIIQSPIQLNQCPDLRTRTNPLERKSERTTSLRLESAKTSLSSALGDNKEVFISKGGIKNEYL